MLKTYSREEMLRYWKRRLGLLATCTVMGVSDLNELDARLMADIDSWYAGLLATAPTGMLPVEDVKEEAYAAYTGRNSAEIIFPKRASRFVSLRLAEWSADEHEVEPAGSARHNLQRDPLTAALVTAPLLVERPGGLLLYGVDGPEEAPAASRASIPPKKQKPELERLLMVAAPSSGAFTLDPLLLRSSELPL